MTEGDNMKNQSVENEIYDIMREAPKGTIFSNCDFHDLGSADAIRKALARLTNKKKIYRLIDGFYAIPYVIEIVQEYSYPSVEELADKIAERFHWNIAPCGDLALNQVGLSTQVPAVYEYVSDGPYREYIYLDQTIRFKHISNRSISMFSRPLSRIIQSIKALGKENITEREVQIMARYCSRFVKENIKQDTKTVPVWIYKVLKQISEESLYE